MVFRRSAIEGKKLNPIGYKIVLEVVVRSGSKRIVEVPFTFINRKTGKSHTNKKIILEYIRHLGRLYWFKLTRLS
jgi:dolichol-phosphate mannosyltransferase